MRYFRLVCVVSGCFRRSYSGLQCVSFVLVKTELVLFTYFGLMLLLLCQFRLKWFSVRKKRNIDNYIPRDVQVVFSLSFCMSSRYRSSHYKVACFPIMFHWRRFPALCHVYSIDSVYFVGVGELEFARNHELPLSMASFIKTIDYGDSKDLSNAVKLVPDYTEVQPRRQPS